MESEKTPIIEQFNYILRYFEYSHLTKSELKNVSKQFKLFAETLVMVLPNGPEKSVALRKLLESKEAAVRSALELTEEK